MSRTYQGLLATVIASLVTLILLLIYDICTTPLFPLRASDGPGCHSVACGNIIALPGGSSCGVFVDGRAIFITYDGQLALNFIAKNGLKTCEEVKP